MAFRFHLRDQWIAAAHALNLSVGVSDRMDNSWFSMPKDVVLNFLPAPGEDALTCGPDQFSMANE
ncbi:MAG: hypothetical protein OSA23_00105 [Rhodospirillales bacterium]|nr:hypothetical protein [Rhodospirillales bacterium]